MQPVDRQRRRLLQTNSLAASDLERAGDYNQRVTLQAIRLRGPTTRVELARVTGLTTPGIANIIHRLLKENLIMEIGRLHGRRGQPAMRLAINPDGCFSIGINIDRDHVTVVMLDFAGKVRARATQELDSAPPETVIAFCRKTVDGMLKNKQFPKDRIIGIGVALPANLGGATRSNRPSSHRAWNTLDVPRAFADAMPLPVLVENDAIAAAIGELQLGHGLRDSSFFYILISAALSGALVIDGHVFPGADGRSGEIGLLPLRSRRTEAKSLQEAVSLCALYAMLAAGGYKITRPDQLSSLKDSGQQLLSGWVDAAADFLFDPLLAVSCLINPKAVFIGGRLPVEIVDRLVERLNQRLHKRAGDLTTEMPVVRAAVAEDAAAIGAAILPVNDKLLPSRNALMKTSHQ